MATAPPRRAVIVHGVTAAAPPPDDADTLQQAAEVGAAMHSLGFQVAVMALGLDLRPLARLADRRPDVIFNLVESLAGRDRLLLLVPSVLEAYGLCFTGSPARALQVTSDKPLAKRLMRAAGIPTADWIGPDEADRPDPAARYIVKSATDHASLGLDASSVVDGGGVAATIDARRRRYGGEWFAERFIDGREFNISVLEARHGPLVLPIAEMTFVDFPPGAPLIVDYAAKWDAASPAYHNTVRRFDFGPEDAPLLSRLEALACACWRCFGLRGYARVDIRVDQAGAPWVLEVNANPCLSSDAGYMAAAAQAGLSQAAVVERLIAAQWSSQGCEAAAE
jgi:D-alanine-D-alanine ligase